ncbi:MAG: conjugal transfer protein TraI [Puia sp.]
MKKLIFIIFLVFGSSGIAHAQTPWQEIIKAVINAADLVIQQIQNETIVLQNAEKEVTNVMSELQLDDITSWVQKQEDLYQEYYNELATVKDLIFDYDKIKGIIKMQAAIVSEYQTAYSLFKQDKHFSATEIDFMYNVYSGILDESIKNLDQAMLVVNSLTTSMTDAARLNIIDNASRGMQKNYDDLKRFNNQNIQLSLARGQATGDVESVKQLYGLE